MPAIQSVDASVRFDRFCNELDLDVVTKRVSEEHPDWTKERLNTAEQEYRKWLFLCTIKPSGVCLGMGATPGSKDVDEVWHAHILFTRKYQADCQRLCGYFVHHEPTLETDDPKTGVNNYRTTLKLYLSFFHEQHPTWFSGPKTAGDCSDGDPNGVCSNTCSLCGNPDGCNTPCSGGT